VSRGTLITIEGLDGAGKSTLATGLVAALEARGVSVTLVKDPSLAVDPRAEALLYAAARAQLVAERLEPLLAAGTCVLLDRFVDSSLAYQGAGRGLGMDAVAAINALATGGLQADRTLLLRLDPAVGRARQSDRGEAPDRLEQESGAFFDRIAAAYDELAAREPGRFRVLDATGTAPDVLGAALAAVADLL
jgi:dTMP kinase